MVKFFDKLGPNTIAVISSAVAIVTTAYSTERVSIISQKCHNDILELGKANYELNKSKFEFERKKHLDLMTQTNNSSNVAEVSNNVKYESSSNAIPSSNITTGNPGTSSGAHGSFNTIPSSNEYTLIDNINGLLEEYTLIDNLNKLLEEYGNNVLFLTSILIIMTSIIVLINFQGLLTNYFIEKYGSKYQDYIPKWLKRVWIFHSKVINYTNRYYVFMIIYYQLILLLFGLYLLFRVVLYF